MSGLLYDAVARIARHEADSRTAAALAVVTDVHTTVAARADYAVSVRLRDTGVDIPRVPVAVGALGLAATAATGDLVLVVFAGGDLHGAVVVGRLYHGGLEPPKHDAGQLVLQLPPGESSPNIDLRADPATPDLTLKVGSTEVAVTGKTAKVTIGAAELLVDGNSPEAVSIKAGDASMKLSAGGDIELKAAKTLTMKANDVKIDGQGSVTISGGTVDVN